MIAPQDDQYYTEHKRTLIVKGRLWGQVLVHIRDAFSVSEVEDTENEESILLIREKKSQITK